MDYYSAVKKEEATDALISVAQSQSHDAEGTQPVKERVTPSKFWKTQRNTQRQKADLCRPSGAEGDS